ncbi:hypothetical protein AKJ37_05070 [candidate division MSBL1 archaeon SCGC-AAA259I09]|uniref:RNA-binding protein n=2 Tax=candidate division MSBL1 TaxID=215777 RepID=A0A133UQU9_9EURY|nr:hypothetical protein AKJ62_03815 [candidate division MSBL1 archaeon SCGC-AAA259D14]KXA96519.1 hypothetical protein AKJ37_05070 [candidate division MSBL1 archaeon SCGC-AAA259I09]
MGRVLGIFRVDKVCLYLDDDENVENQEDEADLIETILRYIETPQYLRKTLFPRMEELRFAGILPPLRTPHHPLRNERNKPGDVREGVVVKSGDGKSRLNIGLPATGILEEELEEKTRVTVKLGEKLNGDQRHVELVDEKEVGEYWGFKVIRSNSIDQSLSKERGTYSIGTSRYGQNLYEAVKGIKSDEAEGITISFGGPYRGLYEICEEQGVDPDTLFDVMINVIPEQGTATVRTEEALMATLAVLNIMLRR